MQISSYLRVFNEYFASPEYSNHAQKAKDLLRLTGRVFFLGNGGSNAICSHMYEDFAKILRYQTFAFSDAALITCFSNDYGYEQAMAEWLGIYGQGEGFITTAIPVLKVVLVGLFIASFSNIWVNAVIGTGHTKTVLLAEFLAVIAYSIYNYIVLEQLHLSLIWAWASEWLYWIVLLIPCFIYVRSAKWAKGLI